MDAKEYLSNLLKTAGVAADKQQAVLATFDDPTVLKALDDDLVKGRLRQDEFSRKMDELATKDKKQQDWYATTLKQYNDTVALENEYRAKIAALGQDPNDPNLHNGRPLTNPVGEVLTKAQVEEMLAKRDGNVISIVKGAMKYATDHLHRFGQPLDPDALEKIAVEKNLPLEQAYMQLIAPKLEEKQKADFDAAIARAREEGAKDFASKHKVPMDTQPKEPHLIFDRQQDSTLPPAGPLRERALRDSFVNSWNDQQTVKTSAV